MVPHLQKELHALQCRYEHCETQRMEVTRIADLLKDEIRRSQETEKEKDFFLSEANKEIDRMARDYEENLVKKDKEIDELKEQIEDLEKEFTGLTNQAVTLRKLEEEHVHLKQTFESRLHLLVQQKEKELLQKNAMVWCPGQSPYKNRSAIHTAYTHIDIGVDVLRTCRRPTHKLRVDIRIDIHIYI